MQTSFPANEFLDGSLPEYDAKTLLTSLGFHDWQAALRNLKHIAARNAGDVGELPQSEAAEKAWRDYTIAACVVSVGLAILSCVLLVLAPFTFGTTAALAGGLAAANPWKRLAVLFGGPIMNLLAGILIFSLVFVKIGAPDSSIVLINSVSPNSPAALAGFQTGDIVLSVNGAKVTDSTNLQDMIHQNLGKQVTLSLKRNTQIVEVKATPRLNPPAGQGALGVVLSNPVRRITWFESIPIATQMTYEQIKQMALLPGRLIAGNIPPDQARVVGPVDMFDIYQQARQRDTQDQAAANPQSPAVNTLLLMAFISVALGITNLLPIPALDGGRILFVLPEIITHHRVKPEFENTVHMIGFALLILLLVVITTNDFLHPIALP